MPTPFQHYAATLLPTEQVELDRIHNIVCRLLPDAVDGVSYGMPATLYKGKPVISVMVRKKHLSIYPFSGKVIDRLRDKLADYELTSGSIHFSLDHPLSEALIEEIVRCRVEEIDSPKRR